MLVYQPIPRHLTSAETKEFIGRLNQFPLKYDHLLKNHFVKQKHTRQFDIDYGIFIKFDYTFH